MHNGRVELPKDSGEAQTVHSFKRRSKAKLKKLQTQPPPLYTTVTLTQVKSPQKFLKDQVPENNQNVKAMTFPF